MTIGVIGIGDEASKNQKKMKEVAGKNGNVFIHDSFEGLANKVLEMFKNLTCGELAEY